MQKSDWKNVNDCWSKELFNNSRVGMDGEVEGESGKRSGMFDRKTRRNIMIEVE